jgi:hypothetical protein
LAYLFYCVVSATYVEVSVSFNLLPDYSPLITPSIYTEKIDMHVDLPSLLSNKYWGLFPWEHSGYSIKLYLVPRCGAIPLLHHRPS